MENKDIKAEIKKEVKTKVAKPVPKRVRTVAEVKLAIQETEALDKLINEINKGDVSFYTQQNPVIFASPVRPTAMPKDINEKVFNYLDEQLQKKIDKLNKIITGE